MPLRVGFIGCGGIARHHMGLLAKLEDVQMVAFCDINRGKAESAAKQYGGRAYGDHREMYDEEELDAVFICLPPYAHTDQEIMAAERGIALFLEKPVALTLEKAREVTQAIERGGVISSVGYNWRYMEITDKAKEVLGSKKVAFALGRWIGGMPGTSWWRVMAQSGGQMVEQTTHIFDLARYLLGEVKIVYAVASTGLMTEVPNYDVHDASVVNLVFQSGAVANITSSCVVEAGGSAGLDIYTKGLTLKIGDHLEIIQKGRTEIIQNTNNPYLDEDRTFLEAVRSGDSSGIRSSYADATKTLEVTLAANRSIREGKPIKL